MLMKRSVLAALLLASACSAAWHALSARMVHEASAWHEHCGPNACADGADRADRPFFRI